MRFKLRMGLSNNTKNQNQGIEQEAVKAAIAYEEKRTGKTPNVIKKRIGYDLEAETTKLR